MGQYSTSRRRTYATLTTTKIEIDGVNQVIWNIGEYNFSHHIYMLGVYSYIIMFFVGWIASYFFKSPPVSEALTLSGFLQKRKLDKQ